MVDGSKNEEFEAKMRLTDTVEKEMQDGEDDEALAEVVSGTKSIFIKDYGTLTFTQPIPVHAIETDQLVASFKATHLVAGDLLTTEQLKAIYGNPTKIVVKGEEVVVGKAAWTEEQDRLIDELPSIIRKQDELLTAYRLDYQAADLEVKAAQKKKDKEDAIRKKNVAYEHGQTLWAEILNNRKRLLELQVRRLDLFADSLEEMAFMYKVKILAQYCVLKKDGSTLWPDQNTMLHDKNAMKVLILFALFLRGYDVSFFEDAQGAEKT